MREVSQWSMCRRVANADDLGGKVKVRTDKACSVNSRLFPDLRLVLLEDRFPALEVVPTAFAKD